jgi:PhnB protein
MAFLPYLNFGGNCREAFARYHEIFGGDLFVMGMNEMPDGESVPPEQANLVMHAALTFPDGSILMASDVPSDGGFGPVQGMYVNCTVPDLAEGKRVFGELADGGDVQQGFEETFWSPGFGMCTDRFGTPWMVNVEAPADATS